MAIEISNDTHEAVETKMKLGRGLSSTAGSFMIDDGRVLRSHANDLYRFTKCLVLLLL